MPIKEIIEVEIKSFPRDHKPIKERMDINVPLIIAKNIPKRNVSIYVLCDSGGSGKTSLLLSMIKTKQLYRNKFHNIFYICPTVSFFSVDEKELNSKDYKNSIPVVSQRLGLNTNGVYTHFY